MSAVRISTQRLAPGVYHVTWSTADPCRREWDALIVDATLAACAWLAVADLVVRSAPCRNHLVDPTRTASRHDPPGHNSAKRDSIAPASGSPTASYSE